jgi:dsDNA-binding SOS-regulon protein
MELIQYSQDAGTGLVITPVLKDEDIRDELRIWRLENQERFDALLESKQEPPVVEPQVEKAPVLTAKQRLEALKAKQGQ